MAPEQAGDREFEIGPTIDVYGLGAIFYELLTGRPPFRGNSPMQTVFQVLGQRPDPPSRGRPPHSRFTRCYLPQVPGKRPEAAVSNGP